MKNVLEALTNLLGCKVVPSKDPSGLAVDPAGFSAGLA